MNISENEYQLEFKLGNKIGDEAIVSKLSDEAKGIKILNYVKMGDKGSGDNSYIHGSPDSYVKSVKGTLPIGNKFYAIRGAITDPPSTFLRLLGDYFDENNFYYNDIKIYSKNEIDKIFLFDIESPELINIVKLCNDFSINLYSEALSQLLCLKTDAPNDYLSQKEIEAFFRKYNLNFNEIQIVDGCGLSSDNMLSPKIINNFILDMINEMGLDKVLEVLPQAGKDGYAKGLFKGKSVWVKSGSISGVLNYSGVIKTNTETNKYLVFSVMVNNILASDKRAIRNILKKLIVKFEYFEPE